MASEQIATPQAAPERDVFFSQLPFYDQVAFVKDTIKAIHSDNRALDMKVSRLMSLSLLVVSLGVSTFYAKLPSIRILASCVFVLFVAFMIFAMRGMSGIEKNTRTLLELHVEMIRRGPAVDILEALKASLAEVKEPQTDEIIEALKASMAKREVRGTSKEERKS